MNILAQDKIEKYIFSLLDQLNPAQKERLQESLSPFRYNPTPRKFASLVSDVSLMTGEVGRRMIKMFLEEADKRYRDSDDRKAKYYIKEHRKRTIVTMYGSIVERFTRQETVKRSSVILTGSSALIADGSMRRMSAPMPMKPMRMGTR